MVPPAKEKKGYEKWAKRKKKGVESVGKDQCAWLGLDVWMCVTVNHFL